MIAQSRPGRPPHNRRRSILTTLLLATALLVSCGRSDPAPGPTPDLSGQLRAAVSSEGILDHARRFEQIADANNGNRAAGTPGYDASADYVANTLRDAGYDVTVQRFDLPDSAAVLDANLQSTGTPNAREYAPATDFAPMENTQTGEVSAPLRPVDAGSPTSGCEADDFSAFPEGDVALLRRGVCTFGTKARNAEEAGASAAVVFNAGEPEEEILLGSLDRPSAGIPVMGTSAAVGEELLDLDASAGVQLSVAEGAGTTTNVIAETGGGDANNTLMLGAHLDSVPQGPGINDNASGSSTILEIALQLARLDAEPRNRVRFAFWGAEEIGLVGSTHYVEKLTDDEIEDISAYLNFDMVGSTNFVRSVYEGPDEVENVFDDYFDSRGIKTETNSALDGRSDHGPFQDVDVPTGGLFSGAGGSKTEAQAEAFGGREGAPYDPCYHRACDDAENLDEQSIDRLSDGAAHATAVLAQRPPQ